MKTLLFNVGFQTKRVIPFRVGRYPFNLQPRKSTMCTSTTVAKPKKVKKPKKIEKVKGMQNLVPMPYAHEKILKTAQRTCEKFNCRSVQTPIIEYEDLFKRSLGSDVDIISKEMFVFPDVDNDARTLCLRPEGTAGVIRAFIENGQSEPPNRYYYAGPMFRKENPQRGRYRQFTQFGVEVYHENHVHSDVETVVIGYNLLKELGLDQDVELLVHTLGDKQSKVHYSNILKTFFQENVDKLSDESKRRLEQGTVLRILDSKDPMDVAALENVPLFLENSSPQVQERFSLFCDGLRALEIPFSVDKTLVRGLDYYNSTIWEFVAKDHNGAQNAVLAGGRYDQLSSQLGGPPIPAIGWAAGVERLGLLLEKKDAFKEEMALRQKDFNLIGVVEVQDKAQAIRVGRLSEECLRLCQSLRSLNCNVQMFTGGTISKKLNRAERQGCRYVFLLGDNELTNQQVIVKDLSLRSQETISRTSLPDYVQEMLDKRKIT